MKVTFADVELTQMFNVVNVRRSILPTRENFSLNVPSKHGEYYTGFKYQPKEIVIDIIMISDNINANLRSLAWMLDLKEPSKLIIDDEPDKFYYAVLDGSTSIDEILHVGFGTLNFIAFDPFAFSTLEKTYSADTNGKIVINNGGTAPTSPIFETQFNSSCGYITYISPNGIIAIGDQQEIDSNPLPDSERLINDGMGTIGTVIVNSGGKARTDNATIQGTIKTNGYNIRPDSYGTPTDGWHGMTMRKDIPASKDGSVTAKYFEASMNFKLQSDDYFGADPYQKQIGKIEFNIMNEANEFLCGFTMEDVFSAYSFNIPSFYVGEEKIWEDKPSIPSPQRVQQYNPTTKKYEYKNVDPIDIGKWNGFYGKIIIRKEKNKFYFELQRMDQDYQRILSRVSKTYYDNNGTFENVTAKNIMVWFGKYKDHPPLGINYVDHLYFRKDYVADYKDVPNIFGAGDTLLVDCNTAQVYLNGTLFMTKTDVGSNFFEVVEGETEIQVLDTSFGAKPTTTAKITEKFL